MRSAFVLYMSSICPIGCFKKDTLKKNEIFTPARNWGVPRKFISRRKRWSHKSRGLAKWLKVWQNRRRRRDDCDTLTMASRSQRRRDRYELKRIIFLTLLDAQCGIIRCDLEWNIYPWGKIAKKAIFPQAKVTKKAMLKPCNNDQPLNKNLHFGIQTLWHPDISGPMRGCAALCRWLCH